MRRLTTEEFILKALEVHKGKYDYSKSIYKTKKEKLIIICPIHGEFEQSPDGHLRGQGCPKCKFDKQSKERKCDITDFINRANIIHDNYYNYDKFIYTTMHSKSIITCPIHGNFELDPANHLAGKGCPKCAHEKSKKLKLSNVEFINRVKQIHPEFDYSITEYKGIYNPISFTCPKHGNVTLKLAASLLYGKGACPKCHKSKGENLIQKYLDILNIKYITLYSIETPKEIRSSGFSKVDFYLPNDNIIIEYNGVQHYLPVEKFGGELQLLNLLIRDEYIREYCKNNKIKLLEIPYNEKDILGVIDKCLNINSDYILHKFVDLDFNDISDVLNSNNVIINYRDNNLNEAIAMIDINFFYELLKLYKNGR